MNFASAVAQIVAVPILIIALALISISIYPKASTQGIDTDTNGVERQNNQVDEVLKNLIVNADGPISSVQNEGNSTWITWGKWNLVSNHSETLQNDSNKMDFNASISTVKTDNTEGHKHEIYDFELAGVYVTSEPESTILMFNGTGTVNTQEALYEKVPISIKIIDSGQMTASIDTQSNFVKPFWASKGGVIAISIDDRNFHNHFGDSPIFGTVKKR